MAELSWEQIVKAAEALAAKGDLAAAVNLYQQWVEGDEGRQHPVRHVIYFNMGILLKNAGRLDEAIVCYRNALLLKPDLYQASVNLGLTYESKGNTLTAVQTWIGGLQADEVQVTFLNQLGRVMEQSGLLAEAEKYLMRSLVLDPEQPNVVQHYLYIRQKQCKWPVLESLPELSVDKQLEYCGPLGILALTDDPEIQLNTIQNWLVRHDKGEVPHLAPEQGYQHDKIRIGYMSCDFRWHAVSILTAELYGLHDRSKFEVYALDCTAGGMDAMRQRVLSAMDHHVPIQHLSDEQAAQEVRKHEIDILVDLTGLTTGSRYDILTYKPAPIQVAYLGFVGSCGIPEVDYVLADRFVMPEELQPYFVEKPLYLPNVYQINDSQREIAPTPTREACGLPNDAFVFCSFNGSYKITYDIFCSWMRILQRVPNSVLWLCADNDMACDNLRKTAEQQGVSADRLIIAAKVLPAEYLARYRVADLLLDTHPYNAGTTASDALWAGLPVLTCPGRAFASRMAGSLLKSVNMDELIASSVQEFEDKAVFLATHAEEYQALRQRLAEERKHSPLFDAPALVKDMEELYLGLIGNRENFNNGDWNEL